MTKTTEILTSGADRIPVRISLSRVFFSKEHGLALSVQPVAIGINQILSRPNTFSEDVPHWNDLLKLISESGSENDILEYHTQAVHMLRSSLKQMVPAAHLRSQISELWYTIAHSFVHLSLKNSEPAPAPFAFLALGSNARREMTLFSDQDNALIWKGDNSEKTRLWFQNLGSSVCDSLNRAGFRPCPGGIIAANPKWCRPIDEFKANFREWMGSGKSVELMLTSTVFDMAIIAGEPALLDEISAGLFETLRLNPAFLGLWASHVMNIKLPKGAVGAVNRARSKNKQSDTRLHIKQCLKMPETLSRLYAARAGIRENGTLKRMELLKQQGEFSEDFFLNFEFLFNELWSLRFSGELRAWDNIDKPGDEVDLYGLPDTKLLQIRDVLEALPYLMTRINYDFFGGQR